MLRIGYASDQDTPPSSGGIRRTIVHARRRALTLQNLLGLTPGTHPRSDRAGARTQDLPLKRRLLYQLSYAIVKHASLPEPRAFFEAWIELKRPKQPRFRTSWKAIGIVVRIVPARSMKFVLTRASRVEF